MSTKGVNIDQEITRLLKSCCFAMVSKHRIGTARVFDHVEFQESALHREVS